MNRISSLFEGAHVKSYTQLHKYGVSSQSQEPESLQGAEPQRSAGETGLQLLQRQLANVWRDTRHLLVACSCLLFISRPNSFLSKQLPTYSST